MLIMMRRLATMLAFALALSAGAANAQATRTWVSGVGDDANPCSRTAPCKTFAGAISKTAAGGEINAIDPGGYGAVTITKSITIRGVGTNASILSSGTNGIIINLPATTDRVVIQDIEIEGAGTCLSGIRMVSGGSLTVQNTVIRNCQKGIDIDSPADAVITVDSSQIIGSSQYAFNINNDAQRSRTWLTRNLFTNSAIAAFRVNGVNHKVRLNDNKITGLGPTFLLENGGRIVSYGNNLFDDVPPAGYELKPQN